MTKRLTPDQLAAIAAADPAETTAALARRIGASDAATRRARALALAGTPRPLRPHACPDCGAPVRVEGWRCGACSRGHNARSAAAARRAKRRPAASPIPQPDPGLPPLGVVIEDDDGERIQCHACGRFVGNLGGHARAHGLTHAAYRDRYGLDRTQSLVSSAVSAKFRAAALRNGLPALGRVNLAEHRSHRPKGIPASRQTRIQKRHQHDTGADSKS